MDTASECSARGTPPLAKRASCTFTAPLATTLFATDVASFGATASIAADSVIALLLVRSPSRLLTRLWHARLHQA